MALRLELLLVCVAAGCGFHDNGASNGDGPNPPIDSRTHDTMPGSDGSGPEAGPEAGPTEPPPPQPVCFNQGLIQGVCVPPGLGAVPLSGVIDTDGGDPCDSTETIGCVVKGDTITIGGYVAGVGSKPLILAAYTSIDVSLTGTLDVSSQPGAPGAASNGPNCAPATAAVDGHGFGQNDGGAGGGAGGSFATQGGNGGNGDTSPTASRAGATASAAVTVALRGGCDGSSGGNNTDSQGNDTTGGVGGEGGGVIYLAAPTISVEGAIYASGASGSAGGYDTGGGGGGAGGFIGFESTNGTTLSGTARVATNGGGGASGDAQGANDGTDGTHDLTMDVNQVAAGGMAPSHATDGGDGAVLGTNATSAANGATGGGGGGGGGLGFIYRIGTLSGADANHASGTPAP